MATIDWPTDAAFRPARVQRGQDVPKSGWRGFYTGKRETVSAGSDRLTCLVTLPPCASRAAAQKRAAFLAHVASTGDLVRFGPLWLPNAYPLGSIGGAVTVNGAVAAGSRTVVLAGVLSRPNLISNSGFEIDSNSDGLADAMGSYFVGSPVGLGYSLAAGYQSSSAQRAYATSMAGSETIGMRRSAYVGVVAGNTYTWAADVIPNYGQLNPSVHIGWYDSSFTLVGNATNSIAGPGVWTRLSVTATAPASAVWAWLYVWGTSTTSLSSPHLDVDNVQFEQASQSSPYSGLATVKAGDFLSIGGNLLEQYYADATANDAGALTLTLARPAPAAIGNGAAVTWAAPTGSWQLDDDGIALDYSAGAVQAGIAIPFRQVAV